MNNYNKKCGFMRSTIIRMKTNQPAPLNEEKKLFQSGISDLTASGKVKAEFLIMTLPSFYAPLVENL